MSWAHPLDRVSALSLTALQFYKVFWVLLPSLYAAELGWFGVGLATAVSLKVADYYAILEGDAARYERTHLLWHVSLPFVFSAHTATMWASQNDCGARGS